MWASSASTPPDGINNPAGRLNQIDPARHSGPTHRKFAMLEALVQGWPKIRKARIKGNPFFLVPEAGIEPAWAC